MKCDGAVTKSSADPKQSSGAGVAFQNCHQLRQRHQAFEPLHWLVTVPRGVRSPRRGQCLQRASARNHLPVALLAAGKVGDFRRRVEGSGKVIIVFAIATGGVRHCSFWSSLSLNQTVLSTNIDKHLLCVYGFLCVECLSLTQSYLMN